MKLIPAIDLIDGKCVRLEKGDFNTQKVYSEDPAEMAKQFEAVGCQQLHMVDLDGAKSGSTQNLKVLEKVAASGNLNIDFSGGIKDIQKVQDAKNAGASFVGIGSMAVKKPELFTQILTQFGGENIWLGADVREKKIATQGWLEQSDVDLIPLLKSFDLLQTSFVTDIGRDGMLEGCNKELYQEVMEELPKLNLIASGGVNGTEELIALREMGMYGAIVGKAIYEKRISFEWMEKYNLNEV